MNKGQVAYAERLALKKFDEWNNTAGAFIPGQGYYSEIEACIEDAVHIGIQIALFEKIHYNDDGEIVKSVIEDVVNEK